MSDQEDENNEELESEVIEISPDEDTSDSDGTGSEKTLIVSESKEAALSPNDPVAQYMKEVGRYPLLSKEEERALAIQLYEHGDQAAAEKLVTANLRFVVKIALEYAKFGAKLIDLIQEGNVGLMHAVKEYNPYKDVKLITYAVWWIRGYIQEYLMKQYSMVKIGTTANQRKLFYRLQKEKENLERFGTQTVIKQLSGKLGIPEEEVEQMAQRMSGRDLSLNAPVDASDTGSEMMDFQSDDGEIAPDDMVALKEQIDILTNAVVKLKESLNDREMELLEDRLLSDDPVTLQEIGDRHGVSREAVRQMENRLMKKIKDILMDEEDIKEIKDLN